MRRSLGTTGIAFVVLALLVPLAPTAAATGSLATLMTTIETFSWSPPSPDPSGIAWWPEKGRLIVADAEVEEILTHYAGVNTFETTTDGALQDTSDTTAFTNEPVDVAVNGSTVYFTDDDLDEVFIVDIGPDQELGTSDDTRTSFDTLSFGSDDGEGLAYAGGSLLLSDGVATQVYRIHPGSNGVFDGTDDRRTCFDTKTLGMRDPEGITVHPDTGELYLVSRTDFNRMTVSTASGGLVDVIDTGFVAGDGVNPAGVAIAPAPDDPARMDVFIADRAQDNAQVPDENDGRIFEFALSEPTTNARPVVTNPGTQPSASGTSAEGEGVTLQIVASDPNGDPLSYDLVAGTPNAGEILGLPPGLSLDPATGLISGTIAAGATGNYRAFVRVSDGSLFVDRSVPWRVGVRTPNQPPVVTSPGDQTSVEGDVVNLQVVATDPDDDVTYSATGLPPGLWLDCDTGLIGGTIEAGSVSGSPYSVTVSVSEVVRAAEKTSETETFDAEIFTWTVNSADPVPAAPTGLSIAPESVGLQLDWADNTELDLAGYNVYRIDGGTPVKLNGALLATSQYLDPDAPPGQTSNYQVTAVDLGGNESAPAEGSGQRGTIVSHGSASAARVSTTLTIAKPSGAVEGDVMVAAVNIGSGGAITAPAGWEHVRTEGSGTSLRQAVYVRVVGASEPSTYTWTFASSVVASGVIVAYDGVDTTLPVVGTSAGQANGKSASITAPSVEALSGELLVGFFGMPTNAQIAPPAGMVEQAEALVNGKKKVSIEASDDALVATGATGARSALANKPAVSIGQVVVLRPAP